MIQKQFKDSIDEMEKLLKEETFGYLGLAMNEEPYVVPLNYGYIRGKILFHCALTGKKLDYLRKNSQVCFAVGRQAGKIVRHPQGALCHVENDSVICYGIARIVEKLEERREVLTTFNRCLQPGAEEIPPQAASRCFAVEIEISEMTGRSQRGSEYHYYKHVFVN